MRKTFVLVLFLGLAAAASAQTAVTLTKVLDTVTDNAGTVYAATYSVAANKFLASSGGTSIRIYNGTTGAYESNLNITGVTISGLGFFALTAGTDGSIFGFADTTQVLWQWASISAVPAQAASAVPFARCGHVVGTGTSTKVALTGEGDSGPTYIYGTTDDVAYTLSDTIPGTTLPAKNSLAVNTGLNKAWAVGDTGAAIKKATKSGTSWSADVSFVAPTASDSAATLVFDSVNNVLFAFTGATIFALNGDTGAQLGTVTVTNPIFATPGYAGAVVSPTTNAGTLWMAGRTDTNNVVLQKLTYTVTPTPAAVNDWAIYY